MAVKELQTRIALKYDSFANWLKTDVDGLGANLVLLKGELGICEIQTANADSNVAPTVLFKVGDGVKPFKELPWASAKAADVYSWAKASDVELDQDKKQIIFRGGGDVVDGVRGDKVLTFNYATVADAEGIKARLAVVEGSLGLGGGESGESVADILEDITQRLIIIEGEGEGSVSKALADAKDYTDEREAEIKKYTDQAEADAISAAATATENVVKVERARIDALVAADSAQDALISGNTTAINNEKTARENADNAINAKFGDGISANNTVVDAIATAKQAAIDSAASTAQNKVDALANGQVNTNKADIADLKTTVANEKTARENADKDLDERLEKVEAFFEGAAEDSEGLNNALDKLVDIQNYLNGDGTAAGDLLTAISNLNDIVKDGGTLEVRVDAVESTTSANAGNITTLQNLTSGYTGTGAIKTAIDGVSERAEKGITDAAAAKTAADNAQGDIDDLVEVVGNENSGLVQLVNTVKNTADTAASDLAALTGNNGRIATAESKISTLEGIVNSGEGKTIRDDVTALQNITGDSNKGNEALYTSLTTLTNTVNNEKTGLAATYAIADQNKTDINTLSGKVSAIEGDYLKAVDELIFQCGTSSTVTHNVKAN